GVIKTVTHEEVTKEKLGGTMTHNAKSGVAHFAAADETAALNLVRALVGYIPQNNLTTPPPRKATDDPYRLEPKLRRLVPDEPNKPYDMKEIIRAVADGNDLREVQEHFAKNIVVGFIRLNGKSVGVVANQPAYLAG